MIKNSELALISDDALHLLDAARPAPAPRPAPGSRPARRRARRARRADDTRSERTGAGQ